MKNQCPDDGACHHACREGPCFRVLYCGPLSPRSDWTDAEKREAQLRRIAPDLGPPRGVIRAVFRLPSQRTPAVARLDDESEEG